MAQIGPLLRMVQFAFAEIAADELRDFDRPPVPAHVDVVNGRLTVHLLVTPGTPEANLSDLLGALQAAGFRLNTRTEHVAAGWAYLDAINQLAETDVDLQVEAASVVRAELDRALPEAVNVAAGQVLPANCGADVLIGILDSGVDVAHDSLRTSTGDTRIAFLWDQTLPFTGPSPANPPYPYGAAWADIDINASLAGGVALPTVDQSGHGTAVAGVAGSNGRAAPAGRYRGVADSADYIVVKLDAKAHAFPSTANVLDAMRCVFDTADALGRRAVVNLSQGGRLGPHDEHGDFELAIADLLAEDDRRVVVTSAGNLGDADAHIRVFVPDVGTTTVVIDVPRYAGPYVALELWYNLSDWIEVTVTDPFGQSTPQVAGSDNHQGVLCDLFDIRGVRNAGQSRANQFLIVLRSIQRNGDVTPGTWTIDLFGANITSGLPLDAWLDGSDTPARFRAASSACTLTSPATAEGVFAVSAYQMAPSVGPMATLSSQGPGRTGAQVWMLAAPGDPITTCAATNRSAAAHTRQSGTSLAAAMVTGAIAVMMQVNPHIERPEVIDCLTRTARSDADVGIGPLDAWGSGKLDLGAAVQCAKSKYEAREQAAKAAAQMVRMDRLREAAPGWQPFKRERGQ